MDSLEATRQAINNVDRDIIRLLGKRMALAREVRDYKMKHSMTGLSKDRWAELTKQHRTWCKELGVEDALAEPLFEHIHNYVLKNIHSELK